MKYLRNLLVLTVAIIGISSVSVFAQTNVFGKNKEQGLERQVYREILKLNYYGVFDAISFKVDGNVVYLSGKVHQPITKNDARRAVEHLKGVTDVIDNIEVLPLSRFDDQLRLNIVREFDRRGGNIYRYIQGLNPSMRIIVKNGHVSLEGYVSSRGDANLANILANGVFGVFSVKNNLIVESERVN